MIKKFITFIKKYWIVSLAVVIVLPFSVFAAEYINGQLYTRNDIILDSAGPKGNVTFTFFGKSITLNPNNLINTEYYKEGYNIVIIANTAAEFDNFLASNIARLLTGSCSSDCSSKTCGQLNGCGDVCITQTCGANYTCSAAGVCVSSCQSDCGSKKCGMDSCGNSCGTCDSQSYCNGFGNCVVASCGPSNCGFDKAGRSCGKCDSPQSCVSSWYPELKDYFYNCTACVSDCDGTNCGYKDKCGVTCTFCKNPGEVCDFEKGICLPCTKKCDGKKCGDDGCGGTCGTCDGGQLCNNGNCASCTPASCNGVDCGDDGCGGTCSCGKDEICGVDKKCYSCDRAANCEGKSDCEDDGCGGTCGDKKCEKGLFCNPIKGCVPCSCDGMMCGDDGCGNPCGECAPGEEICSNGNCEYCPDKGLECGYEVCGRYYGPCGGGKICLDNKCQ